MDFESNSHHSYQNSIPYLYLNSREKLLSNLRSNSICKRYSRYKGLPIRYAGGKSLAVGYILENIPDGITTLISPFFGGGSVEIACAKELGMKVVGYDIFDILCNYWQVQLSNPRELANRIEMWSPQSDIYLKVKKRLHQHWCDEKKINNKLELAAHYWFNHNLSYGPGFLGWMSKIYQNEYRVKRLIDKVRQFRCPGLSVQQGNFEEILPKYKKSFLYCDPPYYLNDSKMFRGIYPQRNFPVHHKGFNHILLRDFLKKHKGGFVLSYNDCSTIRNWYSDYKIIDVSWQYTLGQGETRIGKNRIKNGTESYIKKSHEILIIKTH